MLMNDREIKIAVGGSRRATKWNTQKLFWSDFVERTKSVVRTPECFADYMNYKKAQQDDLKDVGGYVGGTLRGFIRKAPNVEMRDMITLDLDNIPPGETEAVLKRLDGLGIAYTVYSTRKHCDDKPRLRVCIPTNRSMLAEEYEPIARKLGESIGIELCDPTTFQASRLMFWASASSDGQFVHHTGDKAFIDADGVLAMYTDWRNMAEWAEVPGHAKVPKLGAKQIDPTEKKGIVGAFCKVYNVYEAIEAFLPGEYTPCDDDTGRLTYVGGSTVGGAVVYDGAQFIYSHHATDPISGKLCNSFDLVRVYLFGHLDDLCPEGSFGNQLPSFKEMCRFANQDPKVSQMVAMERYMEAGGAPENQEDSLTKFLAGIRKSDNGKLVKSIENIMYILANDPGLKGLYHYDEFANRCVMNRKPPWITAIGVDDKPRPWKDPDIDGLKGYVESKHGLDHKVNIIPALNAFFQNNTRHPVKEYLTGLAWDGNKRLERIFIDYLGAEDTYYNQRATRMWFVGAVKRIMEPGCQFDLMTVLSGQQGDGKTELIRTLAKDWVLEGLRSFKGKEAQELLQGRWLVEIGELEAMNTSTMDAVKQFLTVRTDFYRVSFGKMAQEFPRSCAFIGTTNKHDYLQDRTGGRRFIPIDTSVQPKTKKIHADLPGEVDQIWAEAMVYYQIGDRHYIADDDPDYALFFEAQEAHREQGAWEGSILDFVEKDVLPNWEDIPTETRKLFWAGGMVDGTPLVKRSKVCALEVWSECLDGTQRDFTQKHAREINSILRASKWLNPAGVLRFKQYGCQRGFIPI